MKLWLEQPGPGREIVVASRVRLSRSLEGTPFPSMLDSRGRKNVLEKAEKAVRGEGSLLAGKFRCFAMDSLSGMQAVALAERGAVPASFLSGGRDRVLYLSEEESQSILVNGEDHFLIQSRTPGFSLPEAYAAADRTETILSGALPFAFDERLGYLTCNPVLLGTGMAVSLELHLPALAESGAAARVAANLRPLGIALRGLPDSGEGLQGSLFSLSNRMTLGISEQEAIANLGGIAGQIIAQERAERVRLAGSLSVQDSVGRSLGILRSARLLEYGEFMELYSIVRFGAASGLLEGIRLEKLDTLAMLAQPANLETAAGRAMEREEENAARAALVRKETGSP